MEIVYNLVRESDGTLFTLKDSDEIISLNAACKASLLPADAVPGYRKKADIVLIADAKK